MRHFIYVDDSLIQMYFTQLPQSYRERAHADRTATELEFEASISPKGKTTKTSLIPEHDEGIALLPYVESYLRKSGKCGTSLNCSESFIDCELHVWYSCLAYKLPDGGTDGIFVAFPAESGSTRLKEAASTFVVLGDVANCWYARGATPRPHVTSTLERLLRVWDDITHSKAGDVLSVFNRPRSGPLVNSYMGFSGGRRDVFNQLLAVEEELNQFGSRAHLKGIYRVRDRLECREQNMVVLYPLFLEQI